MVLIKEYDSIEDIVRRHKYLYIFYRKKKKNRRHSPFDVVYFDRDSKSVEERHKDK